MFRTKSFYPVMAVAMNMQIEPGWISDWKSQNGNRRKKTSDNGR
jgi:hypothetical protein